MRGESEEGRGHRRRARDGSRPVDQPVCDGDVISTTASCAEIYERDGKGFYVFETVSTNQDGKQTVRGTWTNIVRGA